MTFQTEKRPANLAISRAKENRVGSGTQGWLGTDLRIVAYVRSCTSKVVLVDGGKKTAAMNEKLPHCLAKSPAAFERLFLAISVKHLKSTLKVHPFALSVK